MGCPLGGVAGDQAAVERDQPDRDEPGLRAERKDLLEGVGQGLRMTSAKAGDRGVVWGLVGAQDAEGDILTAAPLDAAGGALADRVGLEQQRDHRLRLEGGAPPIVRARGAVEGREIHLLDRV